MVWDGFTAHNLNDNTKPQTDLELRELKSLITVVDLAAKIQITKRIRNNSPNALEAKYSFGESSTQSFAIIDFQIRTQEGRVFKGIVQEKSQAFKTYDNALSKGHGAYLLEHDETQNRFSVNLGNWLPSTEIELTMTLVTQVSFVSASGTLYVSVPLGVSSSLLSLTTPCSAHIKAHITCPSTILQIQSTTHSDAVCILSGTNATVEYQSNNILATKLPFSQFDISLKTQDFHLARSWLEFDSTNNSCAALVCFYPPESPSGKNLPFEIIFLVDRSGSMAGPAIQAVKTTLLVAIKSLPPNCFFNIVSFGSHFSFLFSKSTQVNAKSIEKALDEISDMKADMDGTELLKPLKEIFDSSNGGSLHFISRQIFVLTDGEVSNPDAILKLTQEASKFWRIFTFGILSKSSDKIVRGLANAGRGVAEFIRHPNDIEPIVLKQLHRTTQPNVTDIAVDWGGLQVSQTPFRIPPFFPGEQVLIYGFIQNYDPNIQAGSITLRTSSLDGVEMHLCKLENPRVAKTEDCWVHSLAARNLIADLENLRSPFHNELGVLIGESKAVQSYAVDIGVKYRMASKWTSFVIVEERQQAVETTTFLDLSENIPPFPVMAPSIAKVERVQRYYYIRLALHSTEVRLQLRVQEPNQGQLWWNQISEQILQQLKPALEDDDEVILFVELPSKRIQLTGNMEPVPSELKQLESLNFVIEAQEQVTKKIQQYYDPQNTPEPTPDKIPKVSPKVTSVVLAKIVFPALRECEALVNDPSIIFDIQLCFYRLESAKPGMTKDFLAELIRTVKEQ